jgi:parallel beta-helix repeat protein
MLSMGLIGCESDSGSWISDGDIGLPQRDGVECIGEDAHPRQGDTIFVSPGGDDANPGDSRERPLKTLASALCNLRPGQTLQILPGTYHESVIMGAFGTSDQPIIIQGEDQKPVLDGENRRTMGIALVESVNIIVANLEFRNYTDEGLQVIEGSDITIQDNLFIANGRASIDPDADGEGFGVNVDGTHGVQIVGNEASQNGPAPNRVQRGTLGTGINTYEIQDAIIRDNYSHNNIGGGLLVEDSINVTVEGNRISQNELDAGGDYWDGGIWIDGGHDIILRDNIITDNHGPGLEISDEDVQYPKASYGYVIEGNEIRRNLFGIYLFNFGLCPFPSEEIASFIDNVIEDNVREKILCEEWACGEGKACE